MCLPKDEGLRCSKHANGGLKTAYKNYAAATKLLEKDFTPENSELVKKTLLEHKYAKAIWHTTSWGLNDFSKTHKDYPKYEKLHNIYKNLKENKMDGNIATPFKVGNKVTIEQGELTKNVDATTTVVKVNKKGETFVWDKKDPEIVTKLTSVGSEKMFIPTKTRNKKDLQWVIWYVNHHQ